MSDALPTDRTPTALLSVFDKVGIVDFALGLHELGWRLVASGGTARVLVDEGLPVVDVAHLTGVPAILDHRVVTLHPRIHGGVLADRSSAAHAAEMDEHGIEAIDLVVVNLYPFGAAPSVDTIDIGGPALLRAAAKNHHHVGVVASPTDYGPVLDELRRLGGVSADTRRRLAHAAFAATAAYDRAIAAWLDPDTDTGAGPNPDTGAGPEPDRALPERMVLRLERVDELRYGENPHQRGARYRTVGSEGWLDAARQHMGKQLSYLNLLDTDAAWRLVHRFEAPGAVVVKHANPCGVAVATSASDAYEAALACDAVSAFGGVVALNRPVDEALARSIVEVFTEVLIASAVEPAALEVLSARPDLRVLTAPPPTSAPVEARSLAGGFLVQLADPVAADRAMWRVVTSTQPTAAQWSDLEFAWQVCAAMSSNAVVVARAGQAVGIGGGQPNRLDAARLALQRAGDRAAGAVCASDGFFPFPDAVEALAAAGVAVVVQPGGSVRDLEVVSAADRHGLAMVFTGERHFRH